MVFDFSEDLAFDLPEEETPVVAHEIQNRVELLFYKARLIADNGNADDRYGFAVLVVDFRD